MSFLSFTNVRKNKAEESRRKLLVNAIREYLQERKIEIKPNGDIARFFFRFHASDIHLLRNCEYIS